MERHEAYEVFLELYECVVTTLEVIMRESEYPMYGVWAWDRDTIVKATVFYHTLCLFEFVVALIGAHNALAVIRPIGVKLQKRANDQYIAYQMIRETADVLKHLRQHADVEFGQWFAKSADVSGAIGYESTVSGIAACQKHRNNVPH